MKRLYSLFLFIFTASSYGALFSRSDVQKSFVLSPSYKETYKQKLIDSPLKSKGITTHLAAAYKDTGLQESVQKVEEKNNNDAKFKSKGLTTLLACLSNEKVRVLGSEMKYNLALLNNLASRDGRFVVGSDSYQVLKQDIETFLHDNPEWVEEEILEIYKQASDEEYSYQYYKEYNKKTFWKVQVETKARDNKFAFERLLSQIPSVEQYIASCFIDNIETITSRSYTGRSTNEIYTQLCKDKSFVEKLAKKLANSRVYTRMLPEYRYQGICSLIEENPQLLNAMVTSALASGDLEQLDNFHGLTIKNDNLMQEIRTGFRKIISENDNDAVQRFPQSPTAKHIVAFEQQTGMLPLEYSLHGSFHGLTKDLCLVKLHNAIMSKEVQLKNQGYYTFFHGQKWEYQLHASWHTKLRKITNNSKTKDFIFVHVKPQEEDLEMEKSARKDVMGMANYQVHYSRPVIRSLLCMNKGLWYNCYDYVKCSASYFTGNHSNSYETLELHAAFSCLGYKDVYERYETELKSLAEEHASLSKLGNLLLIAVPRDKVAKCVSFVQPGKRIPPMGKTNDVQHFIDILDSTPEKIADFDKTMFVLPMTQDKHGGLNPQSGIKFFEFNAVEKDKWATYKAKEDALFKKIKRDIKKDKQDALDKSLPCLPHLRSFFFNYAISMKETVLL